MAGPYHDHTTASTKMQTQCDFNTLPLPGFVERKTRRELFVPPPPSPSSSSLKRRLIEQEVIKSAPLKSTPILFAISSSQFSAI